jgi:Tol biopolymer transport system component
MRDGRSTGTPVFVRYGDFRSGVTTATGGLVYQSVKPGGLWSVYLASLDPNSRPGDWKRLDLNLGNVRNTSPKWSPDSNRIVYIAQHEDTGQSGEQMVRLRDLPSGQDRAVYHAFGKPFCVWATLQPKLFCLDTAEKTEMFSLAVDSREIAKLHTFPAPRYVWIDYPSPDDRALYISDRLADGGSDLLRVDMATGQEAILDHWPSDSWGSISPDGRWLVKGTDQDIQLRPTSGGAWKSLASLKTFGQFNLTPDGRWLLYHTVDSTGKHSLFRVATTGGAPERLGDFPTNSGSGTLEVSPDGSKLLVSVGDFASGYELWSLENFVPPEPKSELSGVASHSGKHP